MMMNKDEAVQKLSKVARISVAYAEDLYDSFFPKPVVPQYVDENSANDFENWLMSEELEVIKTLVNMHQFGYEVEKGPRYTVRIKGIGGYTTHLNQNLDNQVWFFASNERIDGFRVRHTRKELEEAGFGWVFFCEGVEVKEVDDGND